MLVICDPTAGDTVKLNDINVTLVDVKESNGDQFNKPTEGNIYVLLFAERMDWT